MTLARQSSPRGIMDGMEWFSARMVAIVECEYTQGSGPKGNGFKMSKTWGCVYSDVTSRTWQEGMCERRRRLGLVVEK